MAKNKKMTTPATATIDSELATSLGIPEGWELYLAYGVDMDPEWMAGICPEARILSEVFMSGLGVCVDAEGLATIRQENSHIHGTVWALSVEGSAAMDDLAGVSAGARRRELVKVPVSFKQEGKRGRKTVTALAFAYVSNKAPYSYGPGNPEHFAEIRQVALKKGVSHSPLDRITSICVASGVEVEPMTASVEYLDYVCASCFLPLGKCACSTGWGRQLLHVDRGIQEAVATLNRKGYKTDYSCEGHSPNYTTYLMFRENYGMGDVLPAPEGFKYVKSRCSLDAIRPKKASEEELAKRKAELLANLTEWAEALPYRPEKLPARWIQVNSIDVDDYEDLDVVEDMPDIDDVAVGAEYVAKEDMRISDDIIVMKDETWTVLRKFEAFVRLGSGYRHFWLDGWTFLKSFE